MRTERQNPFLPTQGDINLAEVLMKKLVSAGIVPQTVDIRAEVSSAASGLAVLRMLSVGQRAAYVTGITGSLAERLPTEQVEISKLETDLRFTLNIPRLPI